MNILIIKDNIVTYIDPQEFTSEGVRINGRYDPTTNYANAECIAVKELPAYMAAGRWTYTNGQFTPMSDYEQEVLPQAKADKLEEVNSAYQAAIATLTPTYPDDERLTFDKQEQEARAWLADNDAETPFIDALAAGRQMEKADLVSRIIAKADAFTLASGSLTGQRQRYEDMLEEAESLAAVTAINPKYSLSGGGR